MTIRNYLHTLVAFVVAVCFLTIAVYSTDAIAQDTADHTVQGTVTDAETGAPLPGVNVVVEETTTGTTTNAEGEYELTVPSDDVVLVFSFVGYLSQEVPVEQREEINVALETDVAGLEEIIVVGYGTAQRSHLTGSVGSLQMEEVASRPVVDFGQALYGKVAGVEVQNTTGRPGESSRIQIRGLSSISAGTEPLIVVDGVALPGFDLNTLNASDIESIDILKDASSAAIYGSRGANGVVLVTTKSGTPGDLRVNVNYSYTSQTVLDRVDVMNAEEYAQAAIDAAQIAWVRSGGDPNAPNTIEARGERKYTWPEALENPETLPDVDYQDVIFRRAPMHDVNLNVAGGSDNSRYYASVGFVNQDGIIIETGYNKYSMNINAETNLKDILTIGTRVNAVYSDEEATGDNIHTRTANQYPPIYSVYGDNGYLGGPHNHEGFEPWNSILFRAEFGHPLYRVGEIDDREGLDAIGNAFLELDVVEGLSFRSSLGAVYERNDRSFYENIDTRVSPGVFRQGNLESSMNKTLNYTWENIFNYNRDWGGHNFDIVAGYEHNKRNFYSMESERRGYENDLTPYLGAGNEIIGADDNVNESTLLSILSRVNYNYNGRYMASISFRRDGSSRFGPENKWGNFPAFSAGWRVSEEDFVASVEALSDLTVRTSYGFTGNNNIGNYSWVSTLDQNRVAIGNNLNTIFKPGNVGNEELKWERTQQFNVGLSLGIFEDRIYLEGDYYRSESDDLLLDVPVPTTSGFSSQIRNVGSVRNSGIELELTTYNIATSNFLWTSNASFSSNKGEITSLGPDDAPLIFNSNNMSIINEVGETPFSFFGYDYIESYSDQNEIDDHNVEYEFDVHPGMGKYRDVNGDGRINSQDRTVIGNPQPDFSWAINNSFEYRNFDMSFLLHGNVGGDVYDANWRRSMFYHEGRNYLAMANDRWRSEDEPGDGYIHALSVDVAGTLEREASSYWIMDGTYTRLKDVTLGYTLPTSSTESVGVSHMRFYINATNLFTFQSTTTIDPENFDGGATSSLIGSQHSPYPSARTVSIGINLQF